MASLQARGLLLPTPAAVQCVRRTAIAMLSLPKAPSATMPMIRQPQAQQMDTMAVRRKSMTEEDDRTSRPHAAPTAPTLEERMMRTVADTAADRAEMHLAIASQRAAWNSLILGSLTSVTLFASLSAGLAATVANLSPSAALAFRVSATALYAGASVIGAAVNYLQPSQLAEEQRNAARLFRELERDVKGSVGTGTPCKRDDVDLAVQRVLALDKAYPLPLLGAMLDKFPAKVEPAVWWPENQYGPRRPDANKANGWDKDRGRALAVTAELLRTNDVPEYVTLAKKVLAVNRVLAILGPLLTAVGFVGALLLGVGNVCVSNWATVTGVLGGALASLVNTVEHGGQVGMIFEMYRNCAGYYRRVEEEIAGWLVVREGDRALDRDVAELSVALRLGRSLAELRQIDDKYAGKIF